MAGEPMKLFVHNVRRDGNRPPPPCLSSPRNMQPLYTPIPLAAPRLSIRTASSLRA